MLLKDFLQKFSEENRKVIWRNLQKASKVRSTLEIPEGIDDDVFAVLERWDSLITFRSDLKMKFLVEIPYGIAGRIHRATINKVALTQKANNMKKYGSITRSSTMLIQCIDI